MLTQEKYNKYCEKKRKIILKTRRKNTTFTLKNNKPKEIRDYWAILDLRKMSIRRRAKTKGES